MANSRSAKKSVRRIARRTLINKVRRSRVRSFVRKVEDAVGARDVAAAQHALRASESEIMRAVSKGVFHRNTAARKVSRLSARVRALSAQAHSGAA